ncbi:MAG: hypothetical protein ACRD07_07890 [Acidimicrobiales bacterium]
MTARSLPERPAVGGASTVGIWVAGRPPNDEVAALLHTFGDVPVHDEDLP